MQNTLFIKEKKEQRSQDQKVGYVQYIWDDTKGLKHQVFLHSFLFYPLPSLFAGLRSVVNHLQPTRSGICMIKKNIYRYIIKGVFLVSYVYDFV